MTPAIPTSPRERLLDALHFDCAVPELWPWHIDRYMEQAEAAAVATERARLRAAVEAIPGYRDPRYSGMYESPGLVYRPLVLALLDEQP